MTSHMPSTDDRHAQDRQTLCALFDDELRGDEARFALKRLGHDVQWRQTVGRWQLYGDTLRGQAQGVAARGFADRVALAIQQETVSRQIVVPRVAGGRRGWIGGALAASVAVAALFVTRPFSDDAPSGAGPAAPAQVASAPAATPAPAAVATAPVAPASEAPAAPGPDRSLGLGAAAVAAAEVPRRASERRSTRSQAQRAAARSSRQIELPTAVASSAVASSAVAPTAVAEVAAPAPARPFQPEHVETVSRPWPRAVLPQYSGNGGMTASFSTGASSSPSFYPFEPQATTPPVQDAATERGPLN